MKPATVFMPISAQIIYMVNVTLLQVGAGDTLTISGAGNSIKSTNTLQNSGAVEVVGNAALNNKGTVLLSHS